MSNICNNSNLSMYFYCGINLVLFSVITGLSITTIVIEDKDELFSGYVQSSPRALIPRRTVAGVLLVISALMVLFSILSIIGIKKEKPLLLGLYLGYGAFMMIVIFISGLLLLIGFRWTKALPIFVFNGYFINGLVKVHNGYESMMRGKASGNLQHDLLIEDTDVLLEN